MARRKHKTEADSKRTKLPANLNLHTSKMEWLLPIWYYLFVLKTKGALDGFLKNRFVSPKLTLPPPTLRLLREARDFFSENMPADPVLVTIRESFGFAGRLTRGYPLTSTIAEAFKKYIEANGVVSEHETLSCRKVFGVEDPKGLAIDICTLLAAALRKKQVQDGAGIPRTRGGQKPLGIRGGLGKRGG